jgi:hypothetical protein
MGRLIKLLLILIFLGAIGLIVYSYFGDLSSPNVEIIQTVTPDEN